MTLQKTCFLNDPTKPVSKGDLHDNAPNVRKSCEKTERFLVTTQYGSSPHTDDGVDVRRIFHQLRSVAIENFNEPFKGIFDAHGQVPTKGETPTKRFALGAMFVYQMALLYRYQNGFPLRVGLKAFLKAIGNTRRFPQGMTARLDSSTHLSDPFLTEGGSAGIKG